DSTGIDPDDVTAWTDHGGRVPGEHAGARARLQHMPPSPDSAEPEEAPPQPRLAGRVAALLEEGHEVLRISLLVDCPIRMGVAGNAVSPGGELGREAAQRESGRGACR